jgi:hypothetical protein
MENFTILENDLKELFVAIKLCVNQQLFKKGFISEELYLSAKDKICKRINKNHSSVK